MTDTERIDALLEIAMQQGAVLIERSPHTASGMRLAVPLQRPPAGGIQSSVDPRRMIDEFIATGRFVAVQQVINQLESHEPPF